MDERVKIDHEAMVEALPDYAVGVLDDVTAERVARHLVGCAACREHLSFLVETVALLAPAHLRAATRGVLLARAVADRPEAGHLRPVFPPPVPVPVPVPSPMNPPRRGPGGWLRRVAPVWLAAALLVAPLVAWGVGLQRRQDERDLIYRLVTNPAAAHPLVDSELPTGAVGVFYADPTQDRGYLVAHGLPPLPTDQRYQIWLQSDDGEQIPLGSFDVGAEGEGRVLLRAPAPFDAYAAAAVFAEPRAGGPLPTSPLALGGWLET